METFLYPSTLDYTPGAEPNQATLTVEPLFHGYGTTIGNTLRRVMLSSLRGGALTAIKLQGASHEFTTIKGVKEDMVELTLNLKRVALKVHSDAPVRLKLSKKGEGVVTAGDFAANADVEVVNPEVVLATITDASGSLEMEAMAEQGFGYVQTEERESEELEVGWIKLDALFSPVKNVSFNVEATRVGEITNYDKLVMSIETNGVLTPQEAVRQSTDIILNHFRLLAGEGTEGNL